MTRLSCLLAAVLVMTACDYVVTNTSTTNVPVVPVTGSGTGPTPVPTPATPANPAPTSPGYRTPDPPAGSLLPFPMYGASVAAAVSRAGVETSCYTTVYLDAVVDALRQRDTRWGYACSHGNCATGVSRDALAYHAIAGPEVLGAPGNYTVDVIGSLCTNPVAQWLPLFDGLDPTATWTSRGRF